MNVTDKRRDRTQVILLNDRLDREEFCMWKVSPNSSQQPLIVVTQRPSNINMKQKIKK